MGFKCKKCKHRVRVNYPFGVKSSERISGHAEDCERK